MRSTTGTEPASGRPPAVSPVPPRTARPRHALALGALAALLLSVLAVGGCTDVTTYYGASAEDLHAQRILLLEPALLQPTPAAVQRRVQDEVRAALARSPDVGGLVDGAELRHRPRMALQTLNAYQEFSNTLSLTGVSDPELANRLYNALGVGLLAMVQPVYQPCQTCELGDQLWIVGQLVDAKTGRLVFRAHLESNLGTADNAAVAEEAESMMATYLERQATAMRLRPHRVRFNHLRRLAQG